MTRQLVATMFVIAGSASVALADGGGPAGNAVTPWWDDRTAGLLGGWIGGSVGMLGAAFGVCAGLGIGLRFLANAALVVAGAGVVLVLVGLFALATGQPWHVYYLFFIVGGISALVFGGNYPGMRRRAEQVELQKMAAMDS